MIDGLEDAIETDFMAAIDRILVRMPRHPDLLERVKLNKPLRLNPMNVAKEAGHSRSTIYNRATVLRRIEEIEKGPRDTLRTQVDELKKANLLLNEERKRALDVTAAMIMRMRRLERDSAQAKRRAEREAARPNPNQVVGNVVDFRRPGTVDD